MVVVAAEGRIEIYELGGAEASTAIRYSRPPELESRNLPSRDQFGASQIAFPSYKTWFDPVVTSKMTILLEYDGATSTW